MSEGDGEFPELGERVLERWDANANWWDAKIGDGNPFQDLLIEPAQDRLLAVSPGEVVLDVGCGAGRYTRRLAKQGATVVAFDVSEVFLERARERTSETAAIEYHCVDATDVSAVVALGRRRFDAAVSTMALMDMASIKPVYRALSQCLRPGGRLVATLLHPCFQSWDYGKFAEMTDSDADARIRAGVKVFGYRTPKSFEAPGILGQPRPTLYFHRPLSVLLGHAFAHGFVLDGIEEPTFPVEHARPGGLTWKDLPEIPPIVAMRFRLAAPD